MELHKENKEQKHPKNERREFDRNKDLRAQFSEKDKKGEKYTLEKKFGEKGKFL